MNENDNTIQMDAHVPTIYDSFTRVRMFIRHLLLALSCSYLYATVIHNTMINLLRALIDFIV